HDEGLLVVKESPTSIARLGDTDYDLLITRDGCIYLVGCSLSFDKEFIIDAHTPLYSGAIGVGKPQNLLADFKKYYLYGATAIKNNPVYITSNTWGDRSRDTALCEDFILKELELAKELGVEVLQIDDGWQKGITENSGVASDGVALGLGFYDADPDFWTPRLDRFPHGLEPLAKRASELGIKLGLWYSCDGSNEYANYMRDAQNLLALHQKYGVYYFKLDGIRLDTVNCVKNLTLLLKTVFATSGGKIRFHLDITAGKRYGYLFKREFGNLFVENRYTDWGNYYPHRTLKNLWQLSRYLPTQKLQFEFLNPRRNKAVYSADPLAPNNYGLDYIFASVMFANPLCWLEMSNLASDDIVAVKPLIEIFRSISADITTTIVEPVGYEPDGASFTGLVARGKNHGYILLFRELTASSEFTFDLPVNITNSTTLFSSENTTAIFNGKSANFRAKNARSFILVKYESND
ncbi:MAG: alpha-galactosidase, partial [Clostridia bacterium]|nr:alpha-galactosidase [Clostridia bacterium]